VLPLERSFPIKYWGINNRDSDDTLRIGIYNGFSKAEKWKSLSTGVVQPVSQITDVSYVLAQSLGDVARGYDDSGLRFHCRREQRGDHRFHSRARQLWDTLMTRAKPRRHSRSTAAHGIASLRGGASEPRRGAERCGVRDCPGYGGRGTALYAVRRPGPSAWRSLAGQNGR
jgi:hypothetical protein